MIEMLKGIGFQATGTSFRQSGFDERNAALLCKVKVNASKIAFNTSSPMFFLIIGWMSSNAVQMTPKISITRILIKEIESLQLTEC